LNKSTKLINELFDNYVSNYLTSYGSPYLTHICCRALKIGEQDAAASPAPSVPVPMSLRANADIVNIVACQQANDIVTRLTQF